MVLKPILMPSGIDSDSKSGPETEHWKEPATGLKSVLQFIRSKLQGLRLYISKQMMRRNS